MNNTRHILITGASSGIGQALAEEYAEPATVLFLGGRNQERLKEVARACESKGCTVHTNVIDVRDPVTMAAWISEADAKYPLDLVIANAGISAGTGGPDGEPDEQVRRIFDINITGVLNTIHPAIAQMRLRGRGQVAIMSSIAAFRGMPPAPAYSASKAAVKFYGEGLRGHLRPEGIRVNVICPGYVRSRMTAANSFPMPFLMDADRAAKIIKRGLAKDKPRIVFPWPMHMIVWLLGAMPISWSDVLVSRLPKRD
jgi:short-subunit dehydrogenase